MNYFKCAGGSGGGGGAILTTKTITDNGVYNAIDDNADGYSRVTVNVQKGGLNGTVMNIISSTYTTPT